MTGEYTSKTSTEIKLIITALEDSISDTNLAGKQKINYNGTMYDISEFLTDITKQLNYWRQQLKVAEKNEGTRNNPKRFTRYEGYC